MRRAGDKEAVERQRMEDQASSAGQAIRRVLRKRAYGAFHAPPLSYDRSSRQLFVRGSGNDPQIAAQRIVERVIARALYLMDNDKLAAEQYTAFIESNFDSITKYIEAKASRGLKPTAILQIVQRDFSWARSFKRARQEALRVPARSKKTIEGSIIGKTYMLYVNELNYNPALSSVFMRAGIKHDRPGRVLSERTDTRMDDIFGPAQSYGGGFDRVNVTQKAQEE